MRVWYTTLSTVGSRISSLIVQDLLGIYWTNFHLSSIGNRVFYIVLLFLCGIFQIDHDRNNQNFLPFRVFHRMILHLFHRIHWKCFLHQECKAQRLWDLRMLSFSWICSLILWCCISYYVRDRDWYFLSRISEILFSCSVCFLLSSLFCLSSSEWDLCQISESDIDCMNVCVILLSSSLYNWCWAFWSSPCCVNIRLKTAGIHFHTASMNMRANNPNTSHFSENILASICSIK